MTSPIELISYEGLKRLLVPTPEYRALARLSAKGEFPPGVRITPRGGLLWERGAVEAWINRKLAPLAPGAVP